MCGGSGSGKGGGGGMVDVSTASSMGINVYDQAIKENIKKILRTKTPAELDQIFGRNGEKKPNLAKMFPEAYKIPKAEADRLANRAASKGSPIEGMTPIQRAQYEGSRK